MKWIALGACLLAALPLSTFIRRSPHYAQVVWTLFGLLPFVIDYFHLFMAVDSAAGWGGYVKGIEVSILDIITLALYVASPKPRRAVPFRFPMILYFLMVVLSAFQSWYPKESLFYAWQLARMFLVYATVVRWSSNSSFVIQPIMTGMGTGIIVQAGFAIWERFGLGIIQAGGSIGHQNLLGVVSHFVILPFFALLLFGRGERFPICVVLAGLVTVISTASRATIGLEAFGFGAIFLLSSVRMWTSWKGRILILGVVAMAAIVPAGITSLQNRFEKQPQVSEADYDDRLAYIKAAELMLSEHPLGIGANQFAVIGNIQHYYERAGVAMYHENLANNVHNMYYLTAAETGYQGLFALLLLLGTPLIVAFRCGWRNLKDYRGNLLLGFGVALMTVYLHSWFEWSLATVPVQHLFAITVGLVAGIARELGYWSMPHQYATQSLNPQFKSATSAPKALGTERH